MRDIAGKTAFVTGGASGIGLAMGRTLAGAGARVVLADIDAEQLEAAASGLRDTGAQAMAVELDVSDEVSWTRAARAAADFGPVRILCSNAGVGGGSGALETYDPEVWRWVYGVNAHAHLYAARTFLGAMKASGEPAHVVITSSMVAIVPPPISVAYISSKFAALGIALGLRNELAGSAVGVSVLCPGMAATRIVQTTAALRPAGAETGAAASTARAMGSVLASGMAPEAIGERVLKAIREDEFYIFTHPEWRRLAEPQLREVLDAFGESADPAYAGDDIDGLIAANGGRRFGPVARP